MNNREINLKPISKIDFGKRKLSSKEFTLLWMMILSHFSKMKEAINFYWWDMFKTNESKAPDTALRFEEKKSRQKEISKLFFEYEIFCIFINAIFLLILSYYR